MTRGINRFGQLLHYQCVILSICSQKPIHFLYSLNPLVRSRGGWSLSQWSLGERRGTPWTGRQSITGPHRDKRDKQPHTLTRTILESLINLTCMFLDGRRKPEYPERTHAYTGRTCKLHTERSQSGVEPVTLSLWSDGANHHTFQAFRTKLFNLNIHLCALSNNTASKTNNAKTNCMYYATHPSPIKTN